MSEIKIVYNAVDVGEYIDHRFEIYKNGKKVTSIWLGEPCTHWDDAAKLLLASVYGWIERKRPAIKEEKRDAK